MKIKTLEYRAARDARINLGFGRVSYSHHYATTDIDRLVKVFFEEFIETDDHYDIFKDEVEGQLALLKLEEATL
jgi:hypothetical protein